MHNESPSTELNRLLRSKKTSKAAKHGRLSEREKITAKQAEPGNIA